MYKLQPSSRAATHVPAIMQERFTSPYHCWFEVPLDVRHVVGRVLEKMCMGPNIIHDQDELCMGSQGWKLDERFAWAQQHLTERFSKSRHLEELNKHQTGDKKDQYVDFHSEEFWKKFHEARQKAKDKTVTTGAPMPKDPELMSTICGGLRSIQLY
ncbi:hypothetical protein M9H77_02641 [Catharanthus roseus]|uniref:Uncharacterized protein n=1 Tax=Catharanthus roseus TaxID=4058 RepID=A0ACC0C8W2_CATRO|nr:hypothetical protein M9H77_02641 [Catharanthus roseus]